MRTTAIQTRPLLPPSDDLRAVLAESLPAHIPERSVLVVSSKVVAISQGRCESIPEGVDVAAYKEALIRREAGYFLAKDHRYPYPRTFTITEGSLISSAGIDQSNGAGFFILWPKDPMAAARGLRDYVKAIRPVLEFGLIISDSHSSPLRNGALGFGIGYFGIQAQFDYRHTPDIFGRHLQFERLNVIDSLAASAGVVMGEGGECTPLVLIEEIPHATFAEEESLDPMLRLQVPLAEDVFAPFFADAKWQRGGGA